MLVRQSYRMTCRRLSMRMQEIMHNMKNAVCRVQRAEDEVDRSGCGAAVPKKEQRQEE